MPHRWRDIGRKIEIPTKNAFVGSKFWNKWLTSTQRKWYMRRVIKVMHMTSRRQNWYSANKNHGSYGKIAARRLISAVRAEWSGTYAHSTTTAPCTLNPLPSRSLQEKERDRAREKLARVMRSNLRLNLNTTKYEKKCLSQKIWER